MLRNPRFIIISFIALVLLSCNASERSASPDERAEDVVFSVDPSLVGDPYHSEEIGLRVRPPAEWTRLPAEQRDAVGQSLLDRQLESDFRLGLQDAFVDPESLSFFTVSLVQDADGPLERAEAYVEALAAQVDEEDDEVASFAAFRVDGVEINQFRFLRAERVNFTLVLVGSKDRVGQLDYSIPLQAYEAEGVKLESSIGSIQLAN
ncbi:MAG: hypothetical protein ACLFP4_09725 [Spirochaetales bacterium]